MLQSRKFEKSRGQEGNAAQKASSNQILESILKLEISLVRITSSFGQENQIQHTRIREPQTEIKYDLGHVHYFHYILLEYDSLSMANQGKEYIKLK